MFVVSPFDPMVLALSALAMWLLALAAAALPTVRAASTDPMSALRASKSKSNNEPLGDLSRMHKGSDG